MTLAAALLTRIRHIIVILVLIVAIVQIVMVAKVVVKVAADALAAGNFMESFSKEFGV